MFNCSHESFSYSARNVSMSISNVINPEKISFRKLCLPRGVWLPRYKKVPAGRAMYSMIKILRKIRPLKTKRCSYVSLILFLLSKFFLSFLENCNYLKLKQVFTDSNAILYWILFANTHSSLRIFELRRGETFIFRHVMIFFYFEKRVNKKSTRVFRSSV